MFIITVLLTTVCSAHIIPSVIYFLKSNDRVAVNFNGKLIYNSAGMFLFFVILCFCTVLLAFNRLYGTNSGNTYIYALVIGALSTSFTGIIDDTSRDKTKGMINHGRLFLKGELSGGVIKAASGIFISYIICNLLEYNGMDFIINLLIITFMQNFINLLDLRPGRAIKVYIALSLISMVFLSKNYIYLSLNICIIISLFIYLPYELKYICMMGDVGSNTLGIILGIICSSSGSIIFRIVLLFLLISVQIFAEKYSINELINSSRILKSIDMLGREDSAYDKDTQGNSEKNSRK